MNKNNNVLQGLSFDSLVKDIRDKQKQAEVFEMIEKFLGDANITDWLDLKNILDSKEGFVQWFVQKFFEDDAYILGVFVYDYLKDKLDIAMNIGPKQPDMICKTVGIYKSRKLKPTVKERRSILRK